MSSNPAIQGRAPADAGGRVKAVRLTLALLAALVAGLAVTGVFSRTVSSLLSPGQSASTAAVPIPYAPRQLVVSSAKPLTALVTYIRSHTGIDVQPSGQGSGAAGEQILELPASQSVTAAASVLRSLPGIGYAVPNYIANVAGRWIPNDPGRSGRARGWENLQWNFTAPDGIDAPRAWGNLIADHRAGAKGVVIAVLDSGIAYRNWGTFKRSPDFGGTKFIAPCDLVAGTIKDGVCTNRFPLDRLGHGTFVAGTIAEATNNGFGLTGLAYNASIMPVRVLDANGAGTSSTIAEGVRYAVAHGAQVINLSIEFPPGTTSGEIPDLISAINYAHAKGVVVVASAGNDYNASVDFPAAAPGVIAVGATTKDRCLAAYSDTGKTLDLVAPGGGDDSSTIHTANCHPTRNLPDIYQMTFANQATAAKAVNVDAFALQSGWFGTSMAAPDVSSAAAMVIASGVLGAHPTPDAILARLEATARHLAGATPNDKYGYGLLNIGAATAKGGPLTLTTPVTTTTTTPTTTCTTTTTTPTTTTPTATTPTGTGTPSAAKATQSRTQTGTTPVCTSTTTTTTTPTTTTTTGTTTTTTTGTTTTTTT
jgi:serine protease